MANMKRRMARRLDFGRKSFTEVAGMAVFATQIMLGVLYTPQCRAQASSGSGTDASPLAFEVVSIRPDEPGAFNMAKMRFSSDGYDASNASVAMLIKDAYGIDGNQLSAAPKWISSEKFGIEARIDSDASYTLSKLSQNELKLAHQHMLQKLLADRFNLILHHETKDLPVYSLVRAKGDLKIHEANPTDIYSSGLKTRSGDLVGPHMMFMQLRGGQVKGRISGQGVPLALLVEQLSGTLKCPVVDNTGLAGNYDFDLQWTPDDGPISAADGSIDGQQALQNASSDSPGPSLFTAIKEELGLELKPQRGPVDTLVIDHIEMPSAN
jgi:uncharacterized protein (TIGR03435 family)